MTLPAAIAAEPRSAYVHVPFCAHRCGYCDFTLVANRDSLMTAYLEALERELQALGARRPLDTLFVGGGTPTHLPVDLLARFTEILSRWFELSPDCEFSVEANPYGLTAEKVQVLADAGVNRISLGVQSFDTDVLRTLERDHRREDVYRTVELTRTRIPNVSFDLIFAVPGQSLALWETTLDEAIALAPAHLSTYGLTFEKGTAFWSRREKGVLRAADEELERVMYETTLARLPQAGYTQYEISNFAQPGYECRHNNVYWSGRPYYAFGPGAARYVNGRRETNHRSVTTWLRRVLAGESPVGESEELAPADRAREAIVIGLRRNRGISRTAFSELTGFDLDELAGEVIRNHRAAGWVEDDGESIRLTGSGRLLADSVVTDYL